MQLNWSSRRRSELCLRWLCLALAGALLSSCGGGGSGSPEAPVFPVPAQPQGPDPLLPQQWHLFNTGQSGAVASMDIGLRNLQETGQGVVIGFIDGAIELAHPELAGNVLLGRSRNYLDGSNDPSPPSRSVGAAADDRPGGPDDAHGTAVAGIAVARQNNSTGGRGVAPEARFFGMNAVARPTNTILVDALRHAVDQGADIINNSWGPLDPASGGSRSYYDTSPAWQSAVQTALEAGRNGKGAIVVFAAGNGGQQGDDSNRDGYANANGVIAVGAFDDRGRPASYSEPGTNVLVSAPSGNIVGRASTSQGILTTDISGPRGEAAGPTPETADYQRFFAGTSAAAPMVSGVAALMLQANPRLGWRDVRWLLAQTAQAARPGAADEAPVPTPVNAHGYQRKLGFGRVDAQRAVEAARTFAGLPAAVRCASARVTDSRSIPDDDDAGVSVSHRVEGCAIRTIEFVEVRLEVEHPYSGDLHVTLDSPGGLRSLLATVHLCGPQGAGPCTSLAKGWTFGSVRHLGELQREGAWLLRVSDRQADDVGRILASQIVLHGH